MRTNDRVVNGAKDRSTGLPWWEWGLISAFFVLIAVAWVTWQGGAVVWDAFNHHIYLGRQALEGPRLHLDHFAVGGMSCQYPLGYAPLALMLDAGWSGAAMFQMLAVLSALCAPACWLILWCVVPGRDVQSMALRVAGTVLAMSGVLWWKLLTQTSNDGLGMMLEMWGLALALVCVDGKRWVSRSRLRLLVCALAGFFVGIGFVVKLTQFVGVLAAASVLLFADTGWSCRLKLLIVFTATVILTILLTGGVWGTATWSACGTPIYPFMLDYFRGIELGAGA